MTDRTSGPTGWPPRAPTGRRRGPTRRRRAVHILVWCVAAVVVLAGAGVGFVYLKLDGNIRGIDINAQLGNQRPEDTDNGSMDILVLGSDSRSGANAKYGKDSGTARSDTAMVLHVYEGHRRAAIVSLPRDTLVDRPRCTDSKGRTVPAERQVMFNTAYESGGPACAVKTVEQMSGIRMDHYVEVDFTGFKHLINELGGVEITTSRPIDDPKSHLKLAAGSHTLTGEQALGLVRTRKTIGNGSDLGRIELQQAFIKALLKQVKSVGLFSSPKELFDLADAATSAITTDSQLDSVGKLIGFAGGLKDIDGKDVNTVTLPVRYDPADPNRVLPLQPGARQVWKALKNDKPIPASATRGSAAKTGDGSAVVENDG